MKLDGIITSCAAGEKGITIKLNILNFTDKSKEDAVQLLKWAVYKYTLGININEDPAQKRFEEEHEQYKETSHGA